ncbi:hypothetical protein QTJ16_000634 [Diplocarpon rosae]|uniref:Uncharacterized protein n=1 Tax=Diplocarpon rosae TaxID=946125 RepID=A0AAD9T723_9HELO|nr:hypothetical protein QTJ16_000634 [Diplocarpon rosae]
MFAKLRPHHRRSPSTPTSPAEQASDQASYEGHAHPQLQRYQDGIILEQPVTRPRPPPLHPVRHTATVEGGSKAQRGPIDGDLQTQPGTTAWEILEREQYVFNNLGRLPYTGTQRPESVGNAIHTDLTSPQYSKQQSGMSQHTLKHGPTDPDSESAPSPELQAHSGHGHAFRKSQPGFSSTASMWGEPTPAQPRPGRARLNLLNPMSLLARRRTSQAVSQMTPQSLVSHKNEAKFNETFDPRIRGTVVHDFSAPRGPRRNLSNMEARTQGGLGQNLHNQTSPNLDLTSASEEEVSPWSGGNHTPVFKENFEEEQNSNSGPHARKASDLIDDRDLIDLPWPQPPYARELQKPKEPSSTSEANNGAQRQLQDSSNISAQNPVPAIPHMPERPPPLPPNISASLPVEARRIVVDPSATPPKAGSTRIGRPRNLSEVSAKDNIPRHMKSTSSRFSFDIIGAAKQERLLEDRHRKKALEKKSKKPTDEDGQLEDEFETGYNYGTMDDDSGLEERIPGINAELDEAYSYDDVGFEEPIPLSGLDEDPCEFSEGGGNLGGFTFQQSSLETPVSPPSPTMMSTPRDADGEFIGFAMSNNSFWASQGLQFANSPTSPMPSDIKLMDPPAIQDLELQTVDMHKSDQSALRSSLSANLIEQFPRPATFDDDDLYFDDGIISGPGDSDEIEFDESVFDNIDTDQYGRPLKSLSSLPTLYSPPMLAAGPSPSFNKCTEEMGDVENPTSPTPLTIKGLAPQPSISEHSVSHQGSMGPPLLPAQTLTKDTLAAYQSALAAAAFDAAANGKFRRDSMNLSEQEDAQPGLVTDSSQASHNEPFSPSNDYEQLADDFNYDDALDDDAIIAAANAEALANDDEGFYGQEFGFYSAPLSNEAEFGGYFGPRGSAGATRGLSNRVVSREPNLTPITERSEYSNRNSFMSLAMCGRDSVVSPGLAQLTNMLRSPGAEYEDSDMSFDALLRLRRGAWGGSQASLHSSNGGSLKSAVGVDDGSPVGSVPPCGQGAANLPLGYPNSNQHGGGSYWRRTSTFSLQSEGASAISSPPASPTLTMAFSPLDRIKERDSGETFREHEIHSERKEAETETYEVQSDAGIDMEGENGKEAFREHVHTGSNKRITCTQDGAPVFRGGTWMSE